MGHCLVVLALTSDHTRLATYGTACLVHKQEGMATSMGCDCSLPAGISVTRTCMTCPEGAALMRI